MTVLLPALLTLLASAHAVPYTEYALTPRSRTISPVSVHNVNGTVNTANALTTSSGAAVFHGNSAVTYDFGKNIAGIVSFNVSSTGDLDQFIGISFIESPLWIKVMDATRQQMLTLMRHSGSALIAQEGTQPLRSTNVALSAI